MILRRQIRGGEKDILLKLLRFKSVINFNKEYEKNVWKKVFKKERRNPNRKRNLIIQQKKQKLPVGAKAKADAEVIQAKADAEKVRLAGEAEAAAIRAKGEAVKNRQLVDLNRSRKMEWWVLPTTTTPSGSVPFVKVGQ